MTDDALTGEALRLHIVNCPEGCGECRRTLTAAEARDFMAQEREAMRLERDYFGTRADD